MLGLVVVVAGEDAALADVASAAVDSGASVAIVSRTLAEDVPASVRFRADPADRAMWDRVGMHIEQHLGPVDGVATDKAHQPVLTEVFGADLVRRGHGAVVPVEGEATDVVLRRLGCTPPAALARPPADESHP